MKTYKLFVLIVLLLSLFLSGADAQTKKRRTTKKTKSKITKPISNPIPEIPPTNNFKILVEGANSKVDTPFVFVARDAETYALIRGMVEGLPASSTVDFKRSAVVAAFAGTKNTGGYSVAIRKTVDKIVVDVIAPPKDAMVTQALTTPFQVAVVPVEEERALSLEVPAAWSNQMKLYRVSKGNFSYSGGFAPREKKFDIEGTIGVLSYADYVTYNFNLSGKGNNKQMKLAEMTSGFVKNGSVELARLDAGSFSEMPRPPLKVFGTVSDKKISLTFEPLPTNVSDGFATSGKLEAVKVK